eukprot:Clim_evm78s144 gene=Clim_evmTU78s144
MLKFDDRARPPGELSNESSIGDQKVGAQGMPPLSVLAQAEVTRDDCKRAIDISKGMRTESSSKGCRNRVYNDVAAQNDRWNNYLNKLRNSSAEIGEHLFLSRRSLNPLRIKQLCQALRGNSRIRRLTLAGNTIGPEAVAAIGDLLLYNRSIRYLDLSQCNIDSRGCAALVDALRANTSLQRLNLVDNDLNDQSCRSLIRLLSAHNHSLIRLDLDCNDIDPELIKEVCHIIRRNQNKQEQKYLREIEHEYLMACGAEALLNDRLENADAGFPEGYDSSGMGSGFFAALASLLGGYGSGPSAGVGEIAHYASERRETLHYAWAGQNEATAAYPGRRRGSGRLSSASPQHSMKSGSRGGYGQGRNTVSQLTSLHGPPCLDGVVPTPPSFSETGTPRTADIISQLTEDDLRTLSQFIKQRTGGGSSNNGGQQTSRESWDIISDCSSLVGVHDEVCGSSVASEAAEVGDC